MSIPEDPLTQVYTAIVDMLQAWEPLTDLVRPGNWIDYTSENPNPEKDDITTADLPEIRIIPTTTESHIMRTSNSGSLIKRFEVQIAAGDKRVNKVIFPIQWNVWRAMQHWRIYMDALMWNSKKYVTSFKSNEVSETTTRFDITKGIGGWVSIWSCNVEMFFSTIDLQNTEL